MYKFSEVNISKRRVKVLNIRGDTFQGFCFKRNAKRIFIVDNYLAFVPVANKERAVV